MEKIGILFIGIVAMLHVCRVGQSNPSSTMGFSWIDEGRIATDGGLSRGVGWGDFDGDGDPDLYVANSDGQWNTLYENQGNSRFKKITAPKDAGSEMVIYGGSSQGVNWVDYDNDRDLDLFVVGRGEESCMLFRNDSMRSFQRINEHPLTANSISASMACWADFDLDGDLDVFMAGYGKPNLLFLNLGSGQFSELDTVIVTSNRDGRARACGCGDINNDGLPDLYVANARQPNECYINLDNWAFRQVTSGHMVEDIGYSYGVSMADYDDDGDLDVFVTNYDKENSLYQNNGFGVFSRSDTILLNTDRGGASKGHAWGDYDNDGDLDLYIANGTYAPNMNNWWYLNQGNGAFSRYDQDICAMHHDTSAGMAWADYDRDGDLDIFVCNWGSRDQFNRLYKNITAGNNWITFRLHATISNSYAVGASAALFLSQNGRSKVIYRTLWPITGYASQNDYELHFGLGDYSSIDSVQIHWPLGHVDVFKNIEINTHWLVTESEPELQRIP